MEQNGEWLTILDYASVNKSSISTIRRSLKKNELTYKIENGKYLIWSSTQKAPTVEKLNWEIILENEKLQKENRELKEEISDLKMLLGVLEDSRVYLPPLPNLDN